MQVTTQTDLENKIRIATEGFEFDYYAERIRNLTVKENILPITNFLINSKNEGIAVTSRQNYDMTLTKLAEHVKKSFDDYTSDDIISYLDSHRKPDDIDPKHKWKGSYNLRKIHIGKFSKWLKRPELMEGIHAQKRKEKSSYSPSDLWTSEENIVFLRYCPNVRIRCYHMVAMDSSCRPHEILKLRIKDIIFKEIDGKPYAEILVNGKTGSRHVPLIHSIPYIKEWMDAHPFKNNPNSYFICGERKGLGKKVTTDALNKNFTSYKNELFPRLLNNPNLPEADKKIISTLLTKPWNLYIFRHTALTEKSKFLKESILRSHAGWSMSSNMPQIYVHYFSNESSESILEAYGLKPSATQKDKLKAVTCPHCGTDNKIDSKFCSSCKMFLTFEAVQEAQEQRDKERLKEKEALRSELLGEMEQMKEAMIKSVFEATKSQIKELERNGVMDYRKGITEEYVKKEYESDEKGGIPVKHRIRVGDLLDPTEAEFIVPEE